MEGKYNGTVYALDVPGYNVSWVQSKIIDMDYETTGAVTGTSEDATIQWRLVIIQSIDCPGGYVVDTVGSTLPSMTSNSGVCVACDPGSSSLGGGQTSCTPCAEGTHNSQAGAASCEVSKSVRTAACAPSSFNPRQPSPPTLRTHLSRAEQDLRARQAQRSATNVKKPSTSHQKKARLHATCAMRATTPPRSSTLRTRKIPSASPVPSTTTTAQSRR